MYNDLITIIVPAYNTEKFIKHSIKSLQSQTYLNIEILVIDDNSDDKTLEICQQLRKKDNRIRIFTKNENRGVADSRNIGLRNARGKYVMFMDSDDCVDKNFCLTMLNTIKEYNADIAFCNYVLVYQKERKYIKLINSDKGIVDTSKVVKTLITASFLWNKIFSRKIFDDIFFPEGVLYEDIKTLYKIIDKAEKIAYVPTYLYFYEQRENSIVHTGELNNNTQYFEAIKQLADFFKEKYPSLFNEECVYLMPAAFNYCMDSGKKGDSLYEEALMILKDNPIPKNLNFFIKLEIALAKISPYFIDILKFTKIRKVYKWIRKDH